MAQLPRLKNGRFISSDCPLCGNGTLRPDGGFRDGSTHWKCDGLLDPDDDRLPLQVCHVSVIDGELLGV